MPHLIVATLYHFVRLPDFRELRQSLLECCNEHRLRGTLLLAEEGINGTMAGSREGIDALLHRLRADARLSDLKHKESHCTEQPFHRMKVKLRREIVTMGVPDTDPARLAGTYLDAEAWNALIADPEVLVIDTRNRYEVEIGRFAGAISPDTESFREFPAFVDRELADRKNRKLALYCTGGIRCEKATSYLKAQGFEAVYHLQGGILKYLETVAPQENRWQGECFVFDARVSVNERLEKGSFDQCHACRRPVSDADKASPDYRKGVSCPRCIDEYSEQQRAAFAERERQVALAEARGQMHIGQALPQKDLSGEA